ncbi:tyrosine-type recombinase/integrase [Enterococcus italicus]|uniref:site-specific integrase n=1 Tax=Enterococcus italicus TaxID=246144 RepID=UPI002072A8EB|nr:tyrosine-type recombinase/integrase [Enterococcus italicus]
MASYVKRGNSWQYEISYKTPEGKFKKMRKSGFRTKSDAKTEAIEMELELNKGYNPDKKNMLVSDYFEQWMKLYKKGAVSNVTYRRYEDTLSNIKKYMEFVSLSDLTRNSYQGYLNEFAKTHAQATTKRFHTHLRASLLSALDNKVILNDVTRNPVIKGANASKQKSDKYLNYKDFKRLIKACISRLEPRYASYYLIIAGGATGARFAELLGLTWNDIDFETNTIDINKTWKLHEGFAPTKNESSVRVIDIDDRTAEILKKYQKEQALLNISNDHNLVFFNARDGAITSNAVNKTLKNIQRELSIEPQITFHGLRHTHASILLYKGIDIISVSERLGHKDVSITQQVYSHVLDEMKKKIKPKLARSISDIYK